MAITKQVVTKDNLFTEHFNFDTTARKIKVAFPANTGIKTAQMQGSSLQLTLQDGTTKSVDLGGLVPAAKADRVLKQVRYDNGSKELVFTVGDNNGGNDNELKVSVADLLPVAVKANSGLEGTGATGHELAVKVDTNGSLKASATGLAVDLTKLKPHASVELTDAFGEQIGFAFTASERSA